MVDTGTPRLPGDSASQATVTVEVTDVNDCPPTFERATYEATVLLPTVRGVRVATLPATDPDPPVDADGVHYDIIEGDEAGAFSVSGHGEVTVARPEALPPAPATVRLRVRASDGRYSSAARLELRLRDADNSGLAFQKSEYYGSVVENSTKPTTIAVLNVLGAALNEHVEFTLLNPEDGFEVSEHRRPPLVE